MDFDLIIIGAGAAGLQCAAIAGARGRRVLVVEHANKPGKKILMSGGGRCNFTNLYTTPENFISANPHFCKSALARYTPQDFIAMVERHGIAYHEKELGQLFCDESSKLILRMLLAECESVSVQIRLDCKVDDVEQTAGGFRLRTGHGEMQATRLVVATGGLSIPSMGASGFGHVMARQFGHSLQPLRAGLVPLTLSGKPLDQWKDLSGLGFSITAECEGASFSNGMLITHRGLSGPAILQISSYWQPGMPLRIDLFPHVDAADYLIQAKRRRPDCELRTIVSEVLPRRFAQRLCETQLVNRLMRDCTPDDLLHIAEGLHAWPITPSGTEGYRTAEVTLGGVDTTEVSSKTMESQRVPGLYFIGEVLDVTGWLGGYNFQWAWASGVAAGRAV